MTNKQKEYIAEILYGEDYLTQYGTPIHLTFTTPDDFFAVLQNMDNKTRFLMEGYMFDTGMSLLECMQQPTFIEDFMREVAKMGGIE